MKPMFPSVAAYSSLTLMSPKRLRNSDQTSSRTPLPMAIRTLWFFSSSFCRERDGHRDVQQLPSVAAERLGFLLPWACCRDSATFHRCTASQWCHISCSRPRTERQKTFSSEQWLYLQLKSYYTACIILGHLSSQIRCAKGIEGIITSLDGSGHPDQEAGAVIERQVDVEDVVRCDSTHRLEEGGGPHPLMCDNGSFRQTFQGQRTTNSASELKVNCSSAVWSTSLWFIHWLWSFLHDCTRMWTRCTSGWTRIFLHIAQILQPASFISSLWLLQSIRSC